MRVLLIGKGAREHALAWKITGSQLLEKLYLWPGNGAMTGVGEALDLDPSASFEQLAKAATQLGIDLVVSGPEAPLSLGLADEMKRHGLAVYGPVKAAAALEASKVFAKDVMARANIPTAAHELVTTEDACRAGAFKLLRDKGGVVLKASGLAAGKGVFVCTQVAEIEEGLRHLYHTPMSAAASTVVLEEVLVGRECSYFSCLGQGGPTGLGFAVDFKRLNDGDLGPNTGGMGCYAPVPWLPANAGQTVEDQVIAPLLRTLAGDGIEYCGWLYVGLMWHPTRGPQVIEFNVRLGDPEAQVLAVHDDRDWLATIASKAGVAVDARAVAAASAPLTHSERAVAVVMTSNSYPYGTSAGASAELPRALFAGAPGASAAAGAAKVFAASVEKAADGVRTAAGRVLTVAARGATFALARAEAYAKVKDIQTGWRAARYRTDIAQRVAQEVDPK